MATDEVVRHCKRSELRQTVMAALGHDPNLLRLRRGGKKFTPGGDRNDGVASAMKNQNWRLDRANSRQRVETILEDQIDRQEWIMPPCHRRDAGVRRFEQQQRDGPLARYPYRDAATERLAVENHSIGTDAFGIQEVESRASVGKEPVLRRTAGIAA